MKLSASPKPAAVQATAHSTAPASPLRSMRPAKGCGVMVSNSFSVSARKSARPPGKWKVASAGVSSVMRSAAHRQRISTPRKRYAFDRAIRYSRAGLNAASSPKISGSGAKVRAVPCLRLGRAAFQRHERLAPGERLSPLETVAPAP